MVTVTDLPYDVFPLIFEHVPSRKTVFNALLVCKTFAEVSIPALYSTLTWRDSDHSAKVYQIYLSCLGTLSSDAKRIVWTVGDDATTARILRARCASHSAKYVYHTTTSYSD